MSFEFPIISLPLIFFKSEYCEASWISYTSKTANHEIMKAVLGMKAITTEPGLTVHVTT